MVRVRDGPEAVAKASDERAESDGFDLVLMDIHMPDTDGVEAAGRIRALYPEEAKAGEGRPPIVAMTANVSDDDRSACRRARRLSFQAFDRQDLTALLSRWRTGEAEHAPQSGAGAA